MSRELPILRLTPKQQPVVWGGDLLHTRLGKPAANEPVGESWEVWEGDGVESGEFAGWTLQQLCDRYGDELLGQVPLRNGSRRFPLLTKFIDAHEPLSVQVHPNDEQAQQLEHQPNGKTEAWYIIAAQPGSWIIHGLKSTVNAASLRKSLLTGSADETFCKVKVEAGNTIFVPAGTIHAIGPGVLLHEVQQTSDVTYRLYDWNRQSQGSRRELHLDKGLGVSWLNPSASPVVQPLIWSQDRSETALVLASEYFTVKRLTLLGDVGLDTAAKSFHIVTVIDGSASIQCAPSNVDLKAGQSVVLPGCLGKYHLSSTQAATVLVEYLADINLEVMPELHDHGFSPGQIEAFTTQFAPLTT